MQNSKYSKYTQGIQGELYKLCYVSDNIAYFTKNLNNQWGDDWDDIPYEHNAGTPYENNNNKIIKVNFDCPGFHTPDYLTLNSIYSVQMINNNITPWLSNYVDTELNIYAGTTLKSFIEQIIILNGIIINVN